MPPPTMSAPAVEAENTMSDSSCSSLRTSTLKSRCFWLNSHSWDPNAPSVIPGMNTGMSFFAAQYRIDFRSSRREPNSLTSSLLE